MGYPIVYYSSVSIVVNIMNQVKNTEEDSSWSIHIYHGRRLLCSFYPSHAWLFVLGATLSALLIFAGSRLSNCATQPSRRSPTQSPQPTQVAPPLQVD